MSKYQLTRIDTTNPAPRCPVVLLLDTSSSMAGEPIRELREGCQQFLQEILSDPTASMSVDLEIITFSSRANLVVPFSPVTSISINSKDFSADGYTSMGEALSLAMKELYFRRRTYRKFGLLSYKPWVVLMTDGAPNDDWVEPASNMKLLAEQGKIQYLGIEIGDCCDHETMCEILPSDPGPIKLKGLRFKEFFKWLSDSLKSVSASAVSEEDNVEIGGIDDWADFE